ncbi:MAG: protoporphyrinogen oxidase [Acidimicrobiia bacterium]
MTVAIVGGGFAGLLVAARLIASGVDDVVVLEASEHPGGVARSVSRDGYILEPGAGSFTLPHPHLSALLDGRGIQPAAATARMRHIWTGDRLITPRSGPAAVLAPLVSPRAKLRGAFEFLVAEPPEEYDESLDTFLRRRLGNDLGRMAAWLAASGVFAGDPARLSAHAAFPALTDLVDSHGSIMAGMRARFRSQGSSARSVHVPLTTMSDLAGQIAESLGGRFKPGVTVNAVRREGHRWIIDGSERREADHVVLATDPEVAANLVTGPLAEALRGSSAAPVVVVGLGGPDLDVPDGFGILTGPDAGMATRGVLLESSYAPHRAPDGHGLVKVIACASPQLLATDDSTVVDHVGAEVARIFGADLDVTFTEVVRHRRGIPQYEVGHRRWLASVDEATPESLHLAGWGYRGVGIAHLATDAFRIAAHITA